MSTVVTQRGREGGRPARGRARCRARPDPRAGRLEAAARHALRPVDPRRTRAGGGHRVRVHGAGRVGPRRLLYALLRDFGEDVDNGSSTAASRTSTQHRRPRRRAGSWPELVAVNALVDTALTVQLEALTRRRTCRCASACRSSSRRRRSTPRTALRGSGASPAPARKPRRHAAGHRRRSCRRCCAGSGPTRTARALAAGREHGGRQSAAACATRYLQRVAPLLRLVAMHTSLLDRARLRRVRRTPAPRPGSAARRAHHRPGPRRPEPRLPDGLMMRRRNAPDAAAYGLPEHVTCPFCERESDRAALAVRAAALRRHVLVPPLPHRVRLREVGAAGQVRASAQPERALRLVLSRGTCPVNHGSGGSMAPYRREPQRVSAYPGCPRGSVSRGSDRVGRRVSPGRTGTPSGTRRSSRHRAARRPPSARQARHAEIVAVPRCRLRLLRAEMPRHPAAEKAPALRPASPPTRARTLPRSTTVGSPPGRPLAGSSARDEQLRPRTAPLRPAAVPAPVPWPDRPAVPRPRRHRPRRAVPPAALVVAQHARPHRRRQRPPVASSVIRAGRSKPIHTVPTYAGV
jgi:hypothetical protein